MTAPISQTSLSPEDYSEKKTEKAVRDWSKFVAVYEALRDAARRRMSGPNDELSLGPTALVSQLQCRPIAVRPRLFLDVANDEREEARPPGQ